MMHAWTRSAAGFVIALLVAASPLHAAAKATVESFTLKNGMEVVVIQNHRVPAVSHMVWYRVGAADDPPGKSGLAHFHEHMMYQGTQAYKAGEYAETVARQGGQENAFTGYDATSYFINIAKEKLPLAMELEVERMRGLKPTDAGAAKEKQVIIEERRMRIENNPRALLSEQMNAALWRNHPYHWPVIGWMHEMEELTKEDVLAFHRRWYHPNNAILVVSGDVTSKEVRALAERHYGTLPRKELPERNWNREPPHNSARRVVLRHANVKQPEWKRRYAAASFAEGKKELALPLFVLAQVIGGGKTSLLYQSLVVEQKLATGIDVNYSGFTLGPGQFEISVVPENGVTMDVLEKAIDKEVERILADGMSESDVSRAKTLLKAESVYARDGLTSMARIMGWLRIVGLEKEYFMKWPELIDAVTLARIQEAARETLVSDASVTGLLLPEKAVAGKDAP